MFGKSLMDLFKDKQRDEMGSELPDDSPDVGESPEERHSYTIQLRHKRRSAILKKVLGEAGYGDLARSVSFKED